jgi:hypothetical protein
MRFVVVARLLCALLVGLGYNYGQDSSASTLLTAPGRTGQHLDFGNLLWVKNGKVTVDDVKGIEARVMSLLYSQKN